MENNLTPEEEAACLEVTGKILAELNLPVNRKNLLIARGMFNLLWPYVKKMYEQGYNDGLIEEGMPLIMEERLSNVLAELKTIANAK